MSARVLPFVTDDSEARRKIREALDTTLVVEAAAGTGKTTELINRILSVLKNTPVRMTEIVAVTFTEKAAGELKLRLREELETARRAEDAADVRVRLEDALEHLEEAHVNTIHGFCAELLRERPVEACVDPLFTVLTEPQADRLYTRAFRGWIQQVLQNPPEGVRRALRRSAGFSASGARQNAGFGGDGPVDRLRNAGRALAETRDFTRAWLRPPFDRDAAVDRLIASVHSLAALTANPTVPRDPLHLDTDGVRRISQQIQLEQSFGQRDLDGWEARLIDLVRDRGLARTRKGSGARFGKDVARTDVLAARDSLFVDLQEFRRDADADLAACLQQELAGATARYQDLKQAGGALDFTDLLARAHALIESNASVRDFLRTKFKRIFVDEFQDTDPLQARILLLLAADVPGKLFIVGDPKQAIYRFRGTDLQTYRAVREQIAASGGEVLQLTTSYRSVPELQQFVNAAFAVEMPDYVPLAKSRPAIAAHPAVIALPVPRPYGRGRYMKASAKAIDASLPDAVGALIDWLCHGNNGWGIAPRDVAVLFRRFVSFGDDVTRGYVEAIEARGIPHLLVGGKTFHGREEVETIRAALAAIEWPDDELSVFATLKGSLFAIGDELLLEFRDRFAESAGRGRFHPFRVPKELGGNSGQDLALSGDPVEHLMPIADALRLLQQLHRQRNYRPVADTIGRLLGETRAHVGFILRPAGEQALANVLHVAELARQYEAGGGISFRGFIDELRAAAESEGAEAPIVEEGSDGVRLMTVHKAKGLEFRVVILADMTCRISRGDASRYMDASQNLCAIKLGGWAPRELFDHQEEEAARDQEEGVRLAYVAATRARDLLVVPAVGDEPWEGGWFSPLNRALYPALAARRSAVRTPTCPSFASRDTVLERPNDEPAGPSTVSPGLFPMDGYSVVWWDPSALALGKKPQFGVRREDLIVKDVSKHVLADGRAAYDQWLLSRTDAREAGATPSLKVQTVHERVETALSPSPHDDHQTVDLRDATTADRSAGVGFGQLVHELLAHAPFDASVDALLDLARVQTRLLALTDDDAIAAAKAVHRVLQHSLLRAACEADGRGSCRRETPVTITAEDGHLVEGVVDLAFEERGAWTVVDYKTDRELATIGAERYRHQLALYSAAIRAATGAPTKGVLLRI